MVASLLGITFPIRETYPYSFLLAEVVSVIVVIWQWRLWHFFHRPLKELNNALKLLQHSDFQSRLLPSPHPVVNRLTVIYNKIIERLQKERIQQQEQGYFLEHLIKASPNGIIILDYDQQMLQVNPAALQMVELPLEKLVGQSLGAIENDFFQRLSHMPKDKEVEILRSGGRRYRCQKSSFIFRGFPQQFILIQDSSFLDAQKEKQAYSKVIRMMSHEVNNTVGAVNSYLDTLKEFVLKDTEMQEDYQEALEVVQGRNQSMATFMANFAQVVKLPEATLETIDLKELLKELVTIYQPKLDSLGIVLSFNIPSDQILVQGDHLLLEQMFMNIFKNAMEAIEQSAVQEQRALKVIWNPQSRKLSIWNSGKRISKEEEQQLFTPFYSSKPTGQGIGLTLCRDILLKHQWDFRLYSPEEGAVFEILLK
ncbi:sensor histidine kinase [Algivirga pacifica]